MQVPERVVDRRCRQQRQILLRATHQPRERCVPACVAVAVCVRFIDEDEPVHVHGHIQDGLIAAELPLLREFLVRDNSGGQILFIEFRLPHAVAELRGGNHQHMVPVLLYMLADQIEADHRLTHADAVGVEHPAVAIHDRPGAGGTVALEGGQAVRDGLRHRLVAVDLDQRTQEHVFWSGVERRRTEQVEQLVAEVVGVVPQALMPPERARDHVRLVSGPSRVRGW